MGKSNYFKFDTESNEFIEVSAVIAAIGWKPEDGDLLDYIGRCAAADEVIQDVRCYVPLLAVCVAAGWKPGSGEILGYLSKLRVSMEKSTEQKTVAGHMAGHVVYVDIENYQRKRRG